ncbi:MAG: Hpt domain-containing protein [Spirochaetales bacterium]|nr:Hpt domain-containing protein [Spirochaetales bacterium]
MKNNQVFNYEEMLALYLNDEKMVKDTILFFREKGAEKIELMKQALAKKNFLELNFQSHALKGDSHNLCAPKLAEQAEKIELLAKDQINHDYEAELTLIEEYFKDFLLASEDFVTAP